MLVLETRSNMKSKFGIFFLLLFDITNEKTEIDADR